MLFTWNTNEMSHRIPVYLDKSRMRDLMRKGMTPGEWLLIELFDRLCSFEEFCNMLEEFDLLEELALLIPASEYAYLRRIQIILCLKYMQGKICLYFVSI